MTISFLIHSSGCQNGQHIFGLCIFKSLKCWIYNILFALMQGTKLPVMLYGVKFKVLGPIDGNYKVENNLEFTLNLISHLVMMFLS